ncbi:hypothetical protein B0H14DRAFT_3699317 [Mycena olivaceomarginata]|nr:hypothetical protein B0H14DRAFT_3699317 [Mycena olivaceomarginata]
MSPQFPSSTEVCIVGAGPSGLACAVGLAARQIPFVIVDALEAGHNRSRAVFIQASALEALGALHPPLSEQLVSDGIQSKTLTALDPQERLLFRIRMTEIAKYTRYAFSLVIPQHKVELRMREYVERSGNSIHWKKRRLDRIYVVPDRFKFESDHSLVLVQLACNNMDQEYGISLYISSNPKFMRYLQKRTARLANDHESLKCSGRKREENIQILWKKYKMTSQKKGNNSIVIHDEDMSVQDKHLAILHLEEKIDNYLRDEAERKKNFV